MLVVSEDVSYFDMCFILYLVGYVYTHRNVDD